MEKGDAGFPFFPIFPTVTQRGRCAFLASSQAVSPVTVRFGKDRRSIE